MDADVRVETNGLFENCAIIESNASIPFLLGRDNHGQFFVKDLAVMPHAIICGVSGAGKTSFLQTVLTAIAYNRPSEEVKFLVFASKLSDYRMFEKSPHLITPIINEPKNCVSALQWTRVEILKRFRLFSETRAKDISAYNSRSDNKLPKVVIVVDDLYDLLSFSGKEAIADLQYVLANGRQAGIHCLVVTATPSNSTVIKEILPFVPCKICFAVASTKESNAVLDQANAARLNTPGEMIFKGVNSLCALQSTYLPDEQLYEIISTSEKNVAPINDRETQDYLKRAQLPNASRNHTRSEYDTLSTQYGDYDNMLPAAVRAVIETKQCSVSMLQRRVKLGYSRAARIVDQMEALGIVGSYCGAKPRTVLVDMAGWERIAESLGITPNYYPESYAERELDEW